MHVTKNGAAGKNTIAVATIPPTIAPRVPASFAFFQPGLGALESLNLALLIHAKHDCLFGRIQIWADDIGGLLDKFRQAQRKANVATPPDP